MRATLTLLLPAMLVAQQVATSPIELPSSSNTVQVADEQEDYVCPMDPDIRSNKPGVCPRCGMKLVKGIPERIEYPVRMELTPRAVRPGIDVRLTFHVDDPKVASPVKDFEIVHEKLFHLFVISQDLKFFIHEHPMPQPDGSFTFEMKFPKPGLYRVLSDFYPRFGTPQLVEKTILVPGAGFGLSPAKLLPDVETQNGENLGVELTTEPLHPVAGQKTLLFVRLRPNQEIEPYLGAMAHMLAASSDLIDLVHSHPVQVTDSPEGDYKQLQFNVFFPREGVYRIWLQMQRKGVVNTVAFNLPVTNVE